MIHLRLAKLLGFIGDVEGGNLDITVSGAGQGDEIGVLASALNTMVRRLKVSMDDLTHEVQVRKQTEAELAQHRDNLEGLVGVRTQALEREIHDRKAAEAKVREAERRLKRQNEALKEQVRHKSFRGKDLKETLKTVAASTARAVEAHRVSVWFFKADGVTLRCAELFTASGVPQQMTKKLMIGEHADYFRALEEERLIPASHAAADPRTAGLADSYLVPAGIEAKLDATLRIRGKTVGVLCVEQTGVPREWHMDEQNFTAAVADFISLAVETAERNQSEIEKKELEARLHRAEKMEAIGTLAGGVAHDLNNILSGIVSYPELLLFQLEEDSPLRKPIDTIRRSGEKAAAIVQDLLSLARRGISPREVVDLNTIVEEFLKSPEFHKMKSYHPDIDLASELDLTLGNISGSPVHLSKIIMNLVSNAFEAIEGCGKITVSTAYRHLDQPLRGFDTIEPGDYAVLRVSDSGIGISADDIGRVFEPFYTKKEMGRSGTGLGMAVVWGTVKDHNGHIDIHSREGEGTQISVYFPITERQQAKTSREVVIDDYRGHGERILVVDDVAEQREIAAGILAELGYEVDTVPSGEAAADWIGERKADLVILDMIMSPGIDGLETYKRILVHAPEQRAIIASGYSESERVRKAIALGVGRYVRKPYSMRTLGRAVQEALNEKDERRGARAKAQQGEGGLDRDEGERPGEQQ
jgi:signal transduction histidine kinase/ActR/RegA family two-component response regulator